MRVSRDWFKDFAPVVWRTIDFHNDGDDSDDDSLASEEVPFCSVTPKVVEKYGRFIAQALNIRNLEHIQTLQNTNVDSLKTIQVRLTDNCFYRELVWDLISRCKGSIHTMRLYCDLPSSSNWLLKQQKKPEYFIRTNDMIPTVCLSPLANGGGMTTSRGNRLTKLNLECVTMTREGFSTLLQRSPSLDELTLYRVSIMGHRDSIPLYTGSNLRYLSASLKQVYSYDSINPEAPCLLLHFPLLKEWDISWMHQPEQWTSDPVCKEFSVWCPQLKIISFGAKGTPLISSLLINTFDTIETCTILGECLTSSTALGLIAHKDTLTSVTIKGTTLQSDWMHWFHMIPRLCLRLQVLSLEPLEFDSVALDSFQWGCQDLRELRVRFKGLKHARNIDGCLNQLCDWRRFGGGAVLTRLKDKETIATRVCHYLFQFKMLRTVWLGTKDYYLPPSLI
jgi:hypothetical protein